MNLRRLFLTRNDCYKSGKKHTVKGIMVHSTGANNPNLKRYLSPDDGFLGKNQYNNHWNTAKPDGRQVCVHAFIGKLADGSVATYQTLPWDMRGWHSGSGSKGLAANANNNGYIGCEICEDGLSDKGYFEKVYREAVELCAYLCMAYGIKPESPTLICHSEGYKLGIASNHGDVMHWWPRFGKSMDTFRADVKAALGAAEPAPLYEVYTVVKGDSLWKIAAAKLDNGARYKEIKLLNGLPSNTIHAGQKLTIPHK
jgi:LysM repeat protein